MNVNEEAKNILMNDWDTISIKDKLDTKAISD